MGHVAYSILEYSIWNLIQDIKQTTKLLSTRIPHQKTNQRLRLLAKDFNLSGSIAKDKICNKKKRLTTERTMHNPRILTTLKIT